LISAPVGAPLAAGDTLQPVLLSAATIVPAQTVSATTQSPLANQVAYASGGVANLNDAPAIKFASAVHNVDRDPAFAMLPDLLQRLGILPRRETALTSFQRSSVGTQDLLYPNSGLQKPVPTLEHGNKGTHPALLQDILHDAIFTHSIVQHLFIEDSLPDDSSALADITDIEAFFNDCLPMKSDKSIAHAIDSLLNSEHHSRRLLSDPGIS
jgi:hypothetical protein